LIIRGRDGPHTARSTDAPVQAGRPFVAMVKTTGFRDGHDPASIRWSDATRFRAVLLQCEVRPSLAVIANE
jgi:hypothetical protein